MKPLTIGIVTISYNQGPFLAEAIESVSIADPSRLNYVVVDPGSTDGSLDIIEKYRSRFNTVILEKDRGPSDGLNKGFAVCDADVYGYINADDFYLPGALDWVLDYFTNHPDVEIITGGVKVADENRKFQRRARYSPFSPQRFLADSCFMIQQSCFFRKSIWDRTSGFNPDARMCWDTELQIDMCLAGAKVVNVSKSLACFRVYGESMSGSGSNNVESDRTHDRCRAKILAAGIQPPTPFAAKLARLAFRLDPVRRVRELVC